MKTLSTLLLSLITNTILAQAPFTTPDDIGAGNCLEFDGVDDFVDCGDINSSTFDGVNQLLTIECWIFPLTTVGHHAITAKYNSSITPNRRTFYFAVRDGGLLNFTAYNQTPLGFIDEITNVGNINADQWFHVTAVVDLQVQTILLYVNGELQLSTTTNSGTTPTSFLDNTIPVELGASVGGGGRGHFWDGQIDEVRIWNIDRTEAQIRDDMCRSIDNTHPQWANLVGYWNMNEGQDGTCTGGEDVCDQSGNGNHGTKF